MRGITVFLTLTFAVFNFANAQNTTYLFGKVRNVSTNTISFKYYPNSVDKTPTEFFVELDGEGKFGASFEINSPKTIEIIYNDNSKSIYLEPGDELDIKFDAKHFDYSFIFSGKGSAHNNFLKQFQTEFGQYNSDFIYYETSQRKPANFKNFMNGLRQRQLSFYKGHELKDYFSTNFTEYIESQIDYKWGYYLMRYRFDNPAGNFVDGPISMPKYFYTFILEIPIHNEAAIGTEYYFKYIKEYLLLKEEDHKDTPKKYVLSVIANKLNVRTEPKVGAQVVGQVLKGDQLQYLNRRSSNQSNIRILGKMTNSYWYKVKLGEKEGWVFGGGTDWYNPAKKSELSEIGSKSEFKNAAKHLGGDVLEYFMVSKIYEDYKNGTLKVSPEDLQKITQTTSNEDFKAVIVQVDPSVNKTTPTNTVEEPLPVVADNTQKTEPITTPSKPEIPIAKTYPIEEKKPITKKENVKQSVTKSNIDYNPVARSTRISGTVSEPTLLGLSLVFLKDPISFEEQEYMLVLDENNRFKREFDLHSPTTLTLIYGDERLELFVEPGDDLKINFNARNVAATIDFKGKGSTHNAFLKQFTENFSNYSINFMQYELAYREASNYKVYVDDIHNQMWAFLKAYNKKERRQFSEAFLAFIYADMDYWWAYQLIRYRWEHPVANNLPSPMEIYPEYYNFLSQIEISNDKAIMSRNYLYFIELYLKMRNENPSKKIISQIDQTVLIVANTDMNVRAYANGEPILTTVPTGTRLKYLKEKSDFKSEYFIRGELRKEYWYKIRTPDNIEGWVFGGGCDFDKPTFKAVKTKKYEVVEEFKKMVAVVKVDDLRIRRRFNLPNAIDLVNEGDEMTYLGEASPETYTFTLRGVSHTEPFYKVQTKNGKIGWAFGGGISLQEQVYKETVIKEEAVTASTNNANQFLRGRALFYTIASELYWKSKDQKPELLQAEIDEFVKNNPYDEFDALVQNALQESYTKAKKIAEGKGDEVPKPWVNYTEQQKAEMAKATTPEPKKEPKPAIKAPVIQQPAKVIEPETVVETKVTPPTVVPEQELLEPIVKEPKKEPKKPTLTIPKEETVVVTTVEEPVEPLESLSNLQSKGRVETETNKTTLKPNLKTIPLNEVDESALEPKEEVVISEPIKEPKKVQPKKEKPRNSSKIVITEEVIGEEVFSLDNLNNLTYSYNTNRLEQKFIFKKQVLNTRNIDEVQRKIDASNLRKKIVKVPAPSLRKERTHYDYFRELQEIGFKRMIEAGEGKKVSYIKNQITFDTLALSPKGKLNYFKNKWTKYVYNYTELPPPPAPVEEEIKYSTAKVQGKIGNYSIFRGGALMIYDDYVNYSEKNYSLNAQDNGSFSCDVELNDIQIGKIKYGSNAVNIFIEPGDELKVNFQGNNMNNTLKFEGKGAANNNFFIELKKRFSEDDNKLVKQLKNNNSNQFKQFMDGSHKRRLEYLKFYSERNNLSTRFYSYAKAEIDYWHAYNMLVYPVEFELFNKRKLNVSGSYYNFLDKIEISNDDAFPNQNYTFFLYDYINHLQSLPENKNTSKIDLAEKHLSGKAKYYVITKELSLLCGSGRLYDVKDYIVQFRNVCPYPEFVKVVNTSYTEARGAIEGYPAPDFKLRDVEGNLVSLSDYQGKVVYIDFWATWCTSCIRQIRYAHKLKDEYKDKDVVFLYISIDEKMETLKSHLNSFPIDGVHVKTENKLNNTISKNYGVKTIPAYFLVDKKGIMHKSPAKSPGTPIIKQQLNLLLSK